MQSGSYCVYKHTFPNNRVYIGMTSKKPEDRWINGLGYKEQEVFSDIIKYGWENIKHEIVIEGINYQEAVSIERRMIREQEQKEKGSTYNKAHASNPDDGCCSTEIIRRIMEEQSISSKELAEKLGVSKQTLSNRLKQKNISVNKLIEMTEALDYFVVLKPTEIELDEGHVI